MAKDKAMPYRFELDNGQLVLTMGWCPDYVEPFLVRECILVPYDKGVNLEPWIGAEVDEWHGNTGRVYLHNREYPTWIDTTNMARTTERKPIKMPRKSKFHDWHYDRGQWQPY
jgi:hypothetical protein